MVPAQTTAIRRMYNMPEDTPSSSTEDVVDVEEHAKAGKPVPSARRYRIRIDKTTYVVDKQFITGRELLTLAGKIPVEKYRIFEHLHGGQTKPIGLDEKVDLAQPGLERFKTLPIDQTEGDSTESPLRRQFKMPSRDSRIRASSSFGYWSNCPGRRSSWFRYGSTISTASSPRANSSRFLYCAPSPSVPRTSRWSRPS